MAQALWEECREANLPRVIAVTKLDQDSAEVLMEIIAALPDGVSRIFTAEVEDHWRYSQPSTVSSGSIEMQRILLSRTMLAGKA